MPEAVMEILNEVGYGSPTPEAVAARAGTSKPAPRRRRRSRQHLVVSALARTIGTTPTPDTGCTHCDLIAGIGTLSEAFTSTLGRRALPGLVADLADDPRLEREFKDTFLHPRRATTAEALRRGIDRGDIRPDADIDLLLDMLASATYYVCSSGTCPSRQNLPKTSSRWSWRASPPSGGVTSTGPAAVRRASRRAVGTPSVTRAG
ncbi:TetR-like C-terminal domain-containing protein [Streptomyces sp. NPDC102437]|uniref:TetR-like C-terminal domain-containing protein n=1 Tax=Streptomyces sp. NPDC102437 TaxID=3366175 RepID=UPI0037F4EC39